MSTNRLVSTILAVSALLLAAPTAFCQDVRLGYCNGDRLGASLRPQSAEGDNNEWSIAIKLPKSILQKYAGDTIYQISYANSQKPDKPMIVFIRKDLSSRGQTQTVTDNKAGWNNITLNKPYPITGEEDLYVGYTAFCTADEANNKEIATAEFYPGGTPGADWYGLNGQWWSLNPSTINYDFCIRAYARGPKKPQYDLGLDRVENYDMIRQNTATTMNLQITNYGLQTVDGFTIEAQKDGQTFLSKSVEDVALKHNEMTKVTVDDLVFPLEGNNNFDIVISKVNGKADEDPSDNTKASYVYSVPQNAQPQPRTMLFEEFTSVTNRESVLADSVYSLAVGPRKDVVWVKYHTDALRLPLQSPYAWFYDNNTVFTPGVMIDRNIFDNAQDRGPAYFIEYNEELSNVFDACAQYPTFATVAVTAGYDKATGKVNVNADITTQVSEMPHQKSLRLVMLALEDSVETIPGDKKEVRILRSFLNDTWGQVVDISNYAASATASFKPDASWNLDRMHVVAYLCNYDSTDPLNCQVYNAAQCTISTPDGIATPVASKAQPQVFYRGGTFYATDGYTVEGVYDIAGQQCDATTLSRGLYLLRLTNGNSTVTVKYMVR